MSAERLLQMEEPMRVVLAFNDALNRHDVEGMMQLMTEDCVFENTNPPPEGSVYSGKAAVTQFWQDFFRQSPHAHIDIEEIFGVGARCIMRWRYEWVDQSGQQGYVRGVDLYQMRDNLICEKLSYVKG
ncbi:MAG: nuclear transport factor 2 family protein [Caldilinea sp.]